jgi:hypothetical protein
MRPRLARSWPLHPVGSGIVLALCLLMATALVSAVQAETPEPGPSQPGVAERPDEAARARILADLQRAGWTCTDEVFHDDGSPYDGTECVSGETGDDQDVARIARAGSIEVYSEMSASAPGEAPWTPDIDALARDIVEFECPGRSDRVPVYIDRLAAGEPATTEMIGTCLFNAGRTGRTVDGVPVVTVFSLVANSSAPVVVAPSASPQDASVPPAAGAASPGPSSTPVVAGGPAEGGPAVALPAFTTAVPAPDAVVTDPTIIATSAILAMLAVLLVPFPGMLFNSTLETHYDEIRGWFPRGRRGTALASPADVSSRSDGPGSGFWSGPLGIAIFLLASAALYGFLDPGFGTGPSTVPMFIGTLIGLSAVTVLVSAGPWRAHARRGDRGRLRALPGTLVVAVVCVLISRLTGFLPGYLYGLLIALEFARSLGPGEGRAGAISAVTLLAAAAGAWLLLGVLPSSASDPVGAVLATALASIVVAGLEGVVFGLVPLQFLPGAAVFAWSRLAWGTIYGIAVFGFLHVLMDPDGGYLASSARTPLSTIVLLLVGFGAVSVGFWGYFRFRPEPTARPS